MSARIALVVVGAGLGRAIDHHTTVSFMFMPPQRPRTRVKEKGIFFNSEWNEVRGVFVCLIPTFNVVNESNWSP